MMPPAFDRAWVGSSEKVPEAHSTACQKHGCAELDQKDALRGTQVSTGAGGGRTGLGLFIFTPTLTPTGLPLGPHRGTYRAVQGEVEYVKACVPEGSKDTQRQNL